MHILFVWSYWQYPKVALEFLEKVKAKGHKVSVLLGDFEGEFDPKRFDGDIDFHFASKWNVLSRFTGTPYPVFRNVANCLRMVCPDVVHINSHLFLSNYQAARAARSLGIPFVVTVHGVMVRRSLVLDALQGLYLRTVAKSMFDMASSVICLTPDDAGAVADIMGGYGKISVISNGVDTELFKPSTERVAGLIVWVGRLVPEKGLVYLLRAMPEIVKERPDAQLVLIGDGILKDELVRLTERLGLEDHVSFLGTIDRGEVAKVLSRANVFAFPSLQEGLPFSVLEAMACGVPVVGSDIPGVRSLIMHRVTGLLVPPKSVESLSSRILSLLADDKLRGRMGEAARRTIAHEYSWAKVIQKVDAIYHDIAEKPFDSSGVEMRLPDEDLRDASVDSS